MYIYIFLQNQGLSHLYQKVREALRPLNGSLPGRGIIIRELASGDVCYNSRAYSLDIVC